jgi:hypothetical protein
VKRNEDGTTGPEHVTDEGVDLRPFNHVLEERLADLEERVSQLEAERDRANKKAAALVHQIRDQHKL